MRTVKRFLAGTSLGLMLLACGDVTGSNVDPPSAVMSAPPALRDGNRARAPRLIGMKPGAPRISTSQASFWAVQGRKTWVAIAHAPSGDGLPGRPFLRFTVPAITQLVDPSGRKVEPGDSILIKVEAFPGQLGARFSPAGLVFGKFPAQLAVSYSYGDLPPGAAGQLAIWYQPFDGAAWELLRSRVDQRQSLVLAEIAHFSNYAVAY